MVFKNVKKIMLDQDVTQKQLATITGYSKGHISAVINGHYESLKVKEAIAVILDEPIETLWAAEKGEKNTTS